MVEMPTASEPALREDIVDGLESLPAAFVGLLELLSEFIRVISFASWAVSEISPEATAWVIGAMPQLVQAWMRSGSTYRVASFDGSANKFTAT